MFKARDYLVLGVTSIPVWLPVRISKPIRLVVRVGLSLCLHNGFEFAHDVPVFETGRQPFAVVILGSVAWVVLQSPDERLVQDGIGRNVATQAFVQGETGSHPLFVFEFPPSNDGKPFC